jgi:hypothetical protein
MNLSTFAFCVDELEAWMGLNDMKRDKFNRYAQQRSNAVFSKYQNQIRDSETKEQDSWATCHVPAICAWQSGWNVVRNTQVTRLIDHVFCPTQTETLSTL